MLAYRWTVADRVLLICYGNYSHFAPMKHLPKNNFLPEQTNLPSSFFSSHKVFEWKRNKVPIEQR